MSQETKAQTRHLMINKTPVDIFRATEHVAAVPCIFGNSQLLSRGVGHANVTFANVVCLRELPRYRRGPDFIFCLRVTLFRRGYVTDVSPTLMTTPPPGQVFVPPSDDIMPWSASNSADGATKHLLSPRTFELERSSQEVCKIRSELRVLNIDFFVCLSVCSRTRG